MDATLLLSQVIGIVMLVGGVAGLLYPARMKRAMSEYSRSTLFPYFDASLALVAGLFIVLTHNIWEGLAASLITLVGWVAIVEGVAIMLLPERSLQGLLAKMNTKGFGTTMAIVALVAGAYLTWFGYFV